MWEQKETVIIEESEREKEKLRKEKKLNEAEMCGVS
jgi:hypothetical protein